MGIALKKHLSKMELSPNDIVIFSIPLGAKDAEWRGFAEGLAADLKENHGINTPLLIIRPGFHLDKLDEATLAEYGLVRVKSIDIEQFIGEAAEAAGYDLTMAVEAAKNIANE